MPVARPTPLARAIVPRDAELAKIRQAFAQAEAGDGNLVCILGEPGIGKTTLVEEFLATLARGSLVGRGNCSERRAETEAYLPIFDALEDLRRKDASGSMQRLIQVVAPTWFAQLTHTQDTGDSPRAPSRHAMLREFRTLAQEASRLGTIVLFLDDVHWADVPTVDLLAHLGQHLRGLRLLILVTCRSTELLLGPHPFFTVRHELTAKGACIDMPLSFLQRPDVDRYLEMAYPNHQFSAAFADLIYARTEGSPLFMVDVLRYLRERNIIAEANGRWGLAREVPDLHHEVPASVRSVIQRTMQRLSDEDRRLLSAGSVQGLQFDSASLAVVLEQPQAEVEEQLQRLERVHELVRRVRDHEFPDGTPSLRYAFVHILYQQALDFDLPPARRAAWSLALARTLETRHAHNTEAAAELGCLFEAGRDFAAAARQFGCAADNAARVFAHKEAIALAQRGLRLLAKLPAGDPQRTLLELRLQTALGLQLQVTRGFADHDAKHAYRRARQLCADDADAATSFPVLWGLWLHSKVRSELARAQEMAEELSALARRQSDPNLALQAEQALGITAFCRGAPTAALHHVEQASVLYDPKRHGTHAHTFGQDPGVICKAFGAVALWILGYPDQAVQQSDAAIAMSREHSPSSRAIAQHFAAMLRQLRGEGPIALQHAQMSSAIASEHELSFWHAGATIFEGWALAVVEDSETGLARLRRGLHGWLATDSVTYHTYYLGLLADVLGRMNRTHDALRILREALALVDQTGEGLFEPELYRMRAEVLLKAQQPSAADMENALEALRKALALSRRQQARSYELRAATSLVKFEQRFGMPLNARSDLEVAYRSLQEGFDTAHLCEARQLLEA